MDDPDYHSSAMVISGHCNTSGWSEPLTGSKVDTTDIPDCHQDNSAIVNRGRCNAAGWSEPLVEVSTTNIPTTVPSIDHSPTTVWSISPMTFSDSSQSSEDQANVYESASAPLELSPQPEGDVNTPCANSGIITHTHRVGLKETSAMTYDESTKDQLKDTVHVVTDDSTKSCDSPTENTRSLRRYRKRALLNGDCHCCPVCGKSLRQGELSSHVYAEVEKLNGLSRCGRKSLYDALRSSHKRKGRTVACKPDSLSPPESTSESRYEIFQRVKNERQSRMAARHKEASQRRCPVCNKCIMGSPSDLIVHVDQCLMNTDGDEDEDCQVDIDGDDDEDTHYEEYTWAGQTRVRVSTMLEGGLAGSGFKCATKDADEDDDDLNVDDDDSELFGQIQYREGDLIPCCSDEPAEEKARKALRKAFLRNENGPASKENGFPSVSGVQPQTECNTGGLEDTAVLNNCLVDTTEVIASLKARIQQDVNQLTKSSIPRCLICMETYTKPLTSIQCWHVHCEDCWLRTLGAKKLCPQCNMITSPTDLRRIYL